MATYDDVKISAIAMIGLLSTILVFALIMLLVVVYYGVVARQDEEKNLRQPWAQRDTLLNNEKAKLVEPRWVDRPSETVAIPIDLAMELVVRELASQRGPEAAAPPEASLPAPEDAGPAEESQDAK